MARGQGDFDELFTGLGFHAISFFIGAYFVIRSAARALSL
jgi:hypothetical protein